MRLFVAIDLPEEVKNEVAGLAGNLPGARWVPMEQFHLTLRFIGETDEALFQAVKAALAMVKGAPFSLALKGIGHFPPGRHPRVLWVGVEGGAPLLELQQKVESALAGVGIPPEERQFSPHITLARLKETPADKVLDLEERQREFATPAFPVGEFYLYSSTLSRAGAIHSREATYPIVACR